MGSSTTLAEHFKLNNGLTVPAVGLGTWVCSHPTRYMASADFDDSNLSQMK